MTSLHESLQEREHVGYFYQVQHTLAHALVTGQSICPTAFVVLSSTVCRLSSETRKEAASCKWPIWEGPYYGRRILSYSAAGRTPHREQRKVWRIALAERVVRVHKECAQENACDSCGVFETAGVTCNETTSEQRVPLFLFLDFTCHCTAGRRSAACGRSNPRPQRNQNRKPGFR